MSAISQPSRAAWVTFPRPNPTASLRLFCFSYAGGGTAFFSAWVPLLPAALELCPIRLPGRESRLSEKPYTRVSAMVPPLVENLRPYLDRPFAFFGHSLGGFVSFETARALRQAGLPQPQRLFISGVRAPHLPDPEVSMYTLSDQEFINRMRQLNGTPEEVLQHTELLALMMPVLRADFEASDTYTYVPEPPLTCSITAFGGNADPRASRAQLEAWREHTTNDFNVEMIPGDHFFLHSARDTLLQALARGLLLHL